MQEHQWNCLLKCSDLVQNKPETPKNISKLNSFLFQLRGIVLPPVGVPMGEDDEEIGLNMVLPTLAIIYKKQAFFGIIVGEHPEYICTRTYKGSVLVSTLQAAVSGGSIALVNTVLTNQRFLSDAQCKAEIQTELSYLVQDNTKPVIRQALEGALAR